MRFNMTFWSFDANSTGNSVKYHIIPTASSMSPFHSLDHDNWYEVQHDISLSCDATDISIGITWCHQHWCHVMPLHWCQHHVMWTAPSMVTFHSLGPDDQNDVQHLWSCDTIGASPGIMWCWVFSMAPLHFIGQDNQHGVHDDLLVIQCHWHWHQCNMMPSTSSMAPLYTIP